MRANLNERAQQAVEIVQQQTLARTVYLYLRRHGGWQLIGQSAEKDPPPELVERLEDRARPFFDDRDLAKTVTGEPNRHPTRNAFRPTATDVTQWPPRETTARSWSAASRWKPTATARCAPPRTTCAAPSPNPSTKPATSDRQVLVEQRHAQPDLLRHAASEGARHGVWEPSSRRDVSRKRQFSLRPGDGEEKPLRSRGTNEVDRKWWPIRVNLGDPGAAANGRSSGTHAEFGGPSEAGPPSDGRRSQRRCRGAPNDCGPPGIAPHAGPLRRPRRR